MYGKLVTAEFSTIFWKNV